MAEKDKTRILIVDDHPIFCLGLTELINRENDMLVCASVEDVVKACAAIEKYAPHLAIIDVSLKDSNGIDLVKEINIEFPGLAVLVLSMYDEELYAERALAAGAKGYMMKQEAISVVVQAIRHILSGKIYASDEVKEKALMRFASQQDGLEPTPFDLLTERELEVFRYIGDGLSTKEISQRMKLSVKTIGTYREHIKEKLNLRHNTELIKCAVYWLEKSRS